MVGKEERNHLMSCNFGRCAEAHIPRLYEAGVTRTHTECPSPLTRHIQGHPDNGLICIYRMKGRRESERRSTISTSPSFVVRIAAKVPRTTSTYRRYIRINPIPLDIATTRDIAVMILKGFIHPLHNLPLQRCSSARRQTSVPAESG